MSPLLIILLAGIGIGTIFGWAARSLFVARDIQRIARQSWRQAEIFHRHRP